MRGSADFKLCNASGNTFSIFTYIILLYCCCDDNSSLLTLLSFLSLSKRRRVLVVALSLLNKFFVGKSDQGSSDFLFRVFERKKVVK